MKGVPRRAVQGNYGVTEVAKTTAKIGPRSQRSSFRKLDGRGVVARRYKGIQDALIGALGGEDALTPQQRLIVEQAAFKLIRVRMIVERLLAEPDKVSPSTEKFCIWYSNSARRDLQALGIEGKAKADPTLGEILRGEAAS